MRAYNMAFIISFIGGIPMSILLAMEINYIIPVLSAITATILFSFRAFKNLIILDYKKLTSNLIVFLNVSLLLLIVFLFTNVFLTETFKYILYFVLYISFIFYICILQDLVYKYTHIRHTSIYR